MNDYYFVFHSVTQAQSALRILKNHAITASLVQAPALVLNAGCSYCIRTSAKDSMRAAGLLQRMQQYYVKIITYSPQGPEEVFL